MSDGLPLNVEQRLAATEVLLKRVAEMIGLDAPRPNEPLKAARWDFSLLKHFSDLRDSTHELNNNLGVLTGLIERLGTQMDAGLDVGRDNRQAIRDLTAVALDIEAKAKEINQTLGNRLHDKKPLLMRDLFWLETNTTEIGLFIFAFGEAIIFMVGDAKLKNSAMFRSLATISAEPAIWGIGVGLMALFALVCFLCRKRKFRSAAMFLEAVYYGVTGFMPLFMSPGVLGWWPHILAFTGAFWVLTRGPSQAI